MLDRKHMSREIYALMEALAAIETADEAAALCDDLCTLKEVQAMAQRLEVARLLRAGKIFTEIAERTGASSATISRVNRCLQAGAGGYTAILDRLDGPAE